MRLKEKVAIITGGGTGIGRATALCFLQEGASVVITGRRREPLEEVVETGKALSVDILAIPSDVAIEDDCRKVVQKTIERYKRIDILVNNAGIGLRVPTHEMDEGEWHTVMNTNLTGPWLMCKEVIPHMLKAGYGSIVNVSSILGERGASKTSAYCSSKGGLILLTKSIATEYGPNQIRCNVVCPGLIETAMTAHFRQSEYGEMAKKKYPLQRFGLPRDVANAILFFASDESGWITGTSLDVDGGLMATPTP